MDAFAASNSGLASRLGATWHFDDFSVAELVSITEQKVVAREYKIAADFKQQMRIRCSSVLQKVVNLSGGNQQKVVLSKWLFSQPEVLILDEPTRGIDVGAKFEIYNMATGARTITNGAGNQF